MSLPCLGIGVMFAVFQIAGMMLEFMERVKSLARKLVAIGPRCLRCLMLMRSGPSELLSLAVEMASETCVELIVMFSVWREEVCLSVTLFVLLVLWV